MSASINFVTTNNGKKAWLKREFDAIGITVDIISPPIVLIEPQADTFTEVSISKVKQAYAFIKKPVIVEDGGFSVPSLNGFPGVYSKYVIQTIGNRGLLKLLEDKKREAYFTTSVSFYDGEILKTFERKIEGSVAMRESDKNSDKAWSELWKIFIPAGYQKTLAELTEDELTAYQKKQSQSSLGDFAAWYRDRIKTVDF